MLEIFQHLMSLVLVGHTVNVHFLLDRKYEGGGSTFINVQRVYRMRFLPRVGETVLIFDPTQDERFGLPDNFKWVVIEVRHYLRGDPLIILGPKE